MNNNERISTKCAELLTLVRNDRFLKGGTFDISAFRFQERDLDIALATAHWKEGKPVPVGWEGVSDLSDLCAAEMKAINGVLYTLPDYSEVSPLLRRCSVELDGALGAAGKYQPPEILDHASYVLKGLLRASITGRRWACFDRLAHAYAAGCWPCGWIFREGQGEVLVFTGTVRF